MSPTVIRRDQLNSATCPGKGDNSGQLRCQRNEKGNICIPVSAFLGLLNHNDAQRLTTVDDRHTEKAVVGFFPTLRYQLESGMSGGITHIDRLGACCHQSHETLFRIQTHLAYRCRVQALCGR